VTRGPETDDGRYPEFRPDLGGDDESKSRAGGKRREFDRRNEKAGDDDRHRDDRTDAGRRILQRPFFGFRPVCRCGVAKICDAVKMRDPNDDDENEQISEGDGRGWSGNDERQRRECPDEVGDERERGGKRSKPIPIGLLSPDRHSGEKGDSTTESTDNVAQSHRSTPASAASA
jgi:hypothetical protein